MALTGANECLFLNGGVGEQPLLSRMRWRNDRVYGGSGRRDNNRVIGRGQRVKTAARWLSAERPASSASARGDEIRWDGHPADLFLGRSAKSTPPRPLTAERAADAHACPPQTKRALQGPNARVRRPRNQRSGPARGDGSSPSTPPVPPFPVLGGPARRRGTEKGRRASRWRGRPPKKTRAPPRPPRPCSWLAASPT